MKKLFFLYLLITFLFSGNLFAQMPPHPELLKKIKSGVINNPFALQNQSLLRNKGIDGSWQSKELNNFRKSSTLGFTRSLGSLKSPSGSWKALAILVQFTDKTQLADPVYFDNLLFSSQGQTLNNYYQQVSYGNLDVVTVNLPSSLGWTMAPQTYSYYCNGQNGLGNYPQNSQKLTEDLVSLLDNQIDFSQYDNDGDGYVDALFIIHTGPGAEFTGNNNDIWSHAWGINPLLLDGVYVQRYSVEPEYWLNPGDMTVGVYAHEMGHAAFGLPDLYDYDGSSAGLGAWSLMASGSWNGSLGDTPSFPDAFCHIQMGYINPTVITALSNNSPINNIESNSQIYLLWTGGNYLNEYFLVENRNLVGYDSQIPGEGLNIFHVDENVPTGNNNEWYPGNTSNGHYLVALEQADGNYELEKGISSGNSGDPFPGTNGNINFDGTTIPDSKDYSGNNSFVSVSNISSPSSTIYADFDVTPNYNFPAPSNLIATAGNNQVALHWDAPFTQGQVELGYDDGTAELRYYVHNPSYGNEYFAVGFTNSLPYTITDGKYYLMNETGNDQWINCYVVGVDVYGNPDLNQILSQSTAFLPSSQNYLDWITVDFPDVSMAANSTFYLLCKWEDSSYGTYSVGEDESAPDYMSLWTADGINWNRWNTGDWMIRAVINSGSVSPFIVQKASSSNRHLMIAPKMDSPKSVVMTEKSIGNQNKSSDAQEAFKSAMNFNKNSKSNSVFNRINLTATFDHYKIYRSTSPGSGYSEVGTSTSTDWIDYSAANRQYYYYVVSAVYINSSGESVYSNEASAFPFDPAIYDISSPFTTNIPVIDGVISPGEWDDATSVNIKTLGSNPVNMLVKNTGTKLYFAVDEYNHDLYSYDQIGIYFDEDHDKLWNNNPGQEGNFWLIWDPNMNSGYGGAHSEYRGIYGNPANFESYIDFPTGLNGNITQKMPGQIQYELEIDLVNSPLNAVAGQTIGLYAWSYSGLNDKFDGEFPIPLDNNWAVPAFYGNLTLGTTTNTPNIVVNPQALSHTVNSETVIIDTFTISNTGSVNLDFTISDLQLSPGLIKNINLSSSKSVDKAADFNTYLKTQSLKSPNVPWLDETPLSGVVPPNQSIDIYVTFNSTGLTPGNHSAMILINSNDVNNPQVVVPANLNVAVDNVTTDDNENNQLSGTPDYDMDTYLFNFDPIVPIEFNIFIKETTINSAQLNLLTWDVDWAASGWQGERDQVWLNGHFLGYLTGANGEWSTTLFNVDPSFINPGPNGKNLVQIYIDEYNEGWAVTVDWGQLVINGTSGNAYIRYVNLDKSIYSAGENVSITEEVDADPTLNVRVETNIVDSQNQILAGTSYNINATLGDEPQTVNLQIPTNASPGNYKVVVLVYDAVTLIQQDIAFEDFTVAQPNVPQIFVNPTSLTVNTFSDSLIQQNFTIYNKGTANLEFNITDLQLTPSIRPQSIISNNSGIDAKSDFKEYLKSIIGNKSPNVSWLDETPLSGSIVPGDSSVITVIFNSTGLPIGNYTAQIIVNSNDPISPTVYVDANLVRAVSNVTTDDNENNQLSGTPDYDMDTYLFNDNPIVPIEFNIFIKETTINSAQLNLLAWDVDWVGGYYGERDQVWMNGHFLGYLTGANGEWSTTLFNVDPSFINPGPNGKNLVQISIDEYNEGWAVTVDWGQLIINGSTGNANIRYALTDKQTYTQGETISVTEEIDANPTMNVRVETNLINEQMQIFAGVSYDITATDGDEPQQIYLQIPTNIPNGNYKIMVVVYDAATLVQQDLEFVDITISDKPIQVGQTIFTGLASVNSNIASPGSLIYTYLKNTNWNVVAIDTVVPVNQGKNYAISVLEGSGGVKDGDTLVFTIVDLNGIQHFERYCFECNVATFSASFPPAIKEYNIKTADDRSLTIPVVQGYNAVSWNVKPANDSTNAVFSELISTGKVQIILDYYNDGYNPAFFNYYIPELTKYNPMKLTSPLRGYFVKLKAGSQPDVLNIYGKPICNEAPIQMNVGYNLVSYLPENSADIPTALSSLTSTNINTVLSYNNDGFGNEWFDAYPQGALWTMNQGQGYFIRLNNHPETLIYPDLFNSYVSPSFANDKKDAKLLKVNEVGGLPMIVVAYGTDVSLNGVLVAAGSKIIAMDKDGITCGEGTFINDGVVSFAIKADDPSTEIDEGANVGEYLSLYLNGNLVPAKIQWKEFGDTPLIDKLDMITIVSESEIPNSFALHNNYPNPFNPSTTIKYDIPEKSHVSLSIYDINGQIVKNLVESEQSAGKYNMVWDGTNNNGKVVTSGIYLLRISAGDFTKIQKMMMLK